MPKWQPGSTQSGVRGDALNLCATGISKGIREEIWRTPCYRRRPGLRNKCRTVRAGVDQRMALLDPTEELAPNAQSGPSQNCAIATGASAWCGETSIWATTVASVACVVLIALPGEERLLRPDARRAGAACGSGADGTRADACFGNRRPWLLSRRRLPLPLR